MLKERILKHCRSINDDQGDDQDEKQRLTKNFSAWYLYVPNEEMFNQIAMLK